MKILIVDNYDSFTFNLYQYIAEITGINPIVLRNDQSNLNDILNMKIDAIVISPGPGRPENSSDFGVCSDIILSCDKPILGVCLGHQGICHLYGGKVDYAPEVMHGRISTIYHDSNPLFNNVPAYFNAVRYHSLIAITEHLPPSLKRIAWTDGNLLMGVQHCCKPIWGIQFHPESICTEYGKTILKNFCNLAESYRRLNNSFKEKTNNPVSVIPSKNRKYESNLKQKLLVCTQKLKGQFDAEKTYNALYSNDKNAIWLDSSRIIDGFSRYSYMGGSGGPLFYKMVYSLTDKLCTVVKNNKKEEFHISAFDFLEQELNKFEVQSPDLDFDFCGGFAGYFGYEIKQDCGYDGIHCSELPDALFLFLDRVIIFDHMTNESFLLCLQPNGQQDDEQQKWMNKTAIIMESCTIDGVSYEISSLKDISIEERPISEQLKRNYATYIKDIESCKEYIRQGESYEICLTNQYHLKETINPYQYYQHLRKINPAPYSAYMHFDELTIACSSPERFVTIDKNGSVTSKPMKGTIKRSENGQEDKKLKLFLENDEKTHAENLMICDLLRNDMGLVCEIGSIHVPELMKVETYATVHQMISLIKGQLKKDLGPIDCIKALFPGGSMTGAPKRRTLQIIDSLETEARGVYSGAIGYISLNGAVDLNIVIRTTIFNKNQISIGVGGAIVAMSDPQEEFDEIVLKGKAPIHALYICKEGTK